MKNVENTKAFPRKMWVWDTDDSRKTQRIVLWINPFGNPKYPVTAVLGNYEKEFENSEHYETQYWHHCAEIEEEPVMVGVDQWLVERIIENLNNMSPFLVGKCHT